MMKEIKTEEAWDKKKIIITIAVLLGLVVALVYFTGAYKVKGDSAKQSRIELQEAVEGAAQSVDVPTIKETVQDKIEEIKTEASNIDIVEVASSSPQVQKIINDIKALENYPKDQAKSMCEKICDSL